MVMHSKPKDFYRQYHLIKKEKKDVCRIANKLRGGLRKQGSQLTLSDSMHACEPICEASEITKQQISSGSRECHWL